MPSGFKNIEAYNRDNAYATDSWKIRAVDELATAILNAQGDNVYAYRFDVDDWHDLGLVNLKDLLGAAHALEIPFVFDKFIKPMRVIFPQAMQEEFNTVADHMSAYWAHFAYTGTPGSGRDGDMPVWSSWNVANPQTPRLMVFDTQSDLGIRMVTDRITGADLKQRFLADASFSSQDEYCQAYQSLFSGEQFDAEEYQRLGKSGCGNVGME